MRFKQSKVVGGQARQEMIGVMNRHGILNVLAIGIDAAVDRSFALLRGKTRREKKLLPRAGRFVRNRTDGRCALLEDKKSQE
jgi:hypothetical protein